MPNSNARARCDITGFAFDPVYQHYELFVFNMVSCFLNLLHDSEDCPMISSKFRCSHHEHTSVEHDESRNS